MHISAGSRVKQFIKKHPESRDVMIDWLKMVRGVSWSKPTDITDSFRRTDCVNGKWLFNIGGNKYRLAARVWSRSQMVRILKVMTHDEYDKVDWSKTPKRSAKSRAFSASDHDAPKGPVRNLSMKTIGKKYKKLMERFALQPIENDDDLNFVDVIADELFERLESLEADEEIYLKVLMVLIEQYEDIAHPLPDEPRTPLHMLKFLMDENGLKQVDLIKILGISSGNASEIYNGKRELTKTQVSILAEYFKANPSLFLPSPSHWQEGSGHEGKAQIVAEAPSSLTKSKSKSKSKRGK
jgi:mRNA-degrading endonuclease HigB of HigAB toxin-antitoxin module/antitoxin component HigA of HigAB toxin-antitoxin module